MSETKTAVNWNSSIQFPTDTCFVNRILSAKFGPSNSSGNPMITLETEVLQPEQYEVGGQLVNIAGVKPKSYYTTKVMDGDDVDVEATAKARARVFVSTNKGFPSLYERLGIDGSTIDPENPDVKCLEGKIILTQMSSKEDAKRKTPTAEQIAKAKAAGKQPEGDVMKHPVTGKALYNYRPQIDEIFALAPEQSVGSNKPY